MVQGIQGLMKLLENIKNKCKPKNNLFLKGPSLENLWGRDNHLFLVLGGTIIFHFEIKMTLEWNKSIN
jgi:hypothetical protein